MAAVRGAMRLSFLIGLQDGTKVYSDSPITSLRCLDFSCLFPPFYKRACSKLVIRFASNVIARRLNELAYIEGMRTFLEICNMVNLFLALFVHEQMEVNLRKGDIWRSKLYPLTVYSHYEVKQKRNQIEADNSVLYRLFLYNT